MLTLTTKKHCELACETKMSGIFLRCNIQKTQNTSLPRITIKLSKGGVIISDYYQYMYFIIVLYVVEAYGW